MKIKTLFPVLSCLLLICLNTACSSSGYVAGNSLYTASGGPMKVEDLPAYLDTQFNNNIPVVIYVHGRGKEPNKSLSRKKIVQKIEKQHQVACIMFNWDSAFRGVNFLDRERPIANVPDGAVKLKAVLGRLPTKQQRGQGRLTLLVHSMGNLVLQEVVGSGGFSGQQIFDNILMTEPDCDAQGHVPWVTALAINEKVFITQNENDSTLKHAGDARLPGVFALGLGVNEPKAANARYLDLSGLVGEGHRVFALGALDSQVNVAETIGAILRGESSQPLPARIASQAGSTIRLKALKDAQSAVFKNHQAVEKPDEEGD